MAAPSVVENSLIEHCAPTLAGMKSGSLFRRTQQDSVTSGSILDIDRNNRSFTTIRDRDFSSRIRFNVPEDVMIMNRSGRPVGFSSMTPGMRVRVRHANFMTASIPPQTTAFEIQIL